MLSTGPRHPYDLQRLLKQTGKRFVTGLPRSLYHAVDKLAQGELIRPVGTEREAGRPERTVYALTDAGRDEVRRRVAVLLATPDTDADVTYAVLSFVAVLPRGQAVDAVRTRADALGAAIARIQGELEQAAGVPRLLLIESEFELARLGAERSWMTGIADQIESGDLAWLDAIPDRGSA